MKQKQKTKSAAKKRFARAGKGGSLIKRAKAFHRHLLSKKNASRRRRLRAGSYIHKADMARIALMLPK